MDPASAMVAASAVSGSTNIGASILNNYYTKKRNQEQREWYEKMYDRQRADSLADWQRQNEYNSPQEQMNRLRQAGLNPNLVYGKGAENTAAQIRSSSPGSYNPESRRIDLSGVSGAINQYYALRQQQTQTDNIAQAIAVQKAQANNIDAGTARILQETAKTKFELEQSQRLKDVVAEKMLLDNNAIRQGIEINAKDYQLRALMNEASRAKTAQDIMESNQRIKGMQLQNSLVPEQRQKLEKEIEQLDVAIANGRREGRLKEADIALREIGVQPGDPMYMRLLVQWLTGNSDNLIQKLEDRLKGNIYNKYPGTNMRSAGGGSW